MTGPWDWGFSFTAPGEAWRMYACPRCGAAVADDEYHGDNRRKHESWHDAWLIALIESAVAA